MAVPAEIELGEKRAEKSWWRSKSWLVERDETARRSKGVRGGRSVGRVGRSVGRRFHFVSLPACGGAIAAALCQSVTLSRHPFYHLARGCPAPLSIRSAPSLLHPHEPRVQRGSRQGWLPDWLPYLLFPPLSLFHSLSLSLFLFISFPRFLSSFPSLVSGRLRELLRHLARSE